MKYYHFSAIYNEQEIYHKVSQKWNSVYDQDRFNVSLPWYILIILSGSLEITG